MSNPKASAPERTELLERCDLAIREMESAKRMWDGIASMPHLAASQQMLIDLLRDVREALTREAPPAPTCET